jgi:phosphopantothenoylcysteine decarboxylase/phosphopantothenate--cysteine ligase
MLIAPLSANTLSKMAHGQCDNLLAGLLPQCHLPGIRGPAMDLEMYRDASTHCQLGAPEGARGAHHRARKR